MQHFTDSPALSGTHLENAMLHLVSQQVAKGRAQERFKSLLHFFPHLILILPCEVGSTGNLTTQPVSGDSGIKRLSH